MKQLICGTITALMLSLPVWANTTQQQMEEAEKTADQSMSNTATDSEESLQKMEEKEGMDTTTTEEKKVEDVQMQQQAPGSETMDSSLDSAPIEEPQE